MGIWQLLSYQMGPKAKAFSQQLAEHMPQGIYFSYLRKQQQQLFLAMKRITPICSYRTLVDNCDQCLGQWQQHIVFRNKNTCFLFLTQLLLRQAAQSAATTGTAQLMSSKARQLRMANFALLYTTKSCRNTAELFSI